MAVIFYIPAVFALLSFAVNPCSCNFFCPENEEFVHCINLCNNCLDKGRCVTDVCVSGCDCVEGYYRNTDGLCVPERLCDITNVNSCPENEIFLECGLACPLNCSSRNKPRTCTYQCIRGCFCRPGFLRNDYGICVPEKECPPEKCGKDEEFLNCGSPCPPSCENKNKSFVCPTVCVSGCYCKKGLFRNADGKCVTAEQCSKSEKPPTLIQVAAKCRNDEIFVHCGSACPPTCENKGKTVPCTQQCVPGCFCKRGLVRSIDGKCIHPGQCPNEGNEHQLIPLQDRCGEDEEFLNCGSACPPSCSNKDRSAPCTLQCVKGCFCKRGLVRNQHGKCVPPDACPKEKRCRKDEIFLDCGSACPPSCANKDKQTPCTLQCVSGCFCKTGLVRKEDGMCIPPEQCPRTDRCGKDEVFLDCGSACPPTCENKGKSTPCPFQCVRGCFCKHGLVRNENRKCVPPEQCPKQELCGKDEVFHECGSVCPATCTNKDKPSPCTLQCVRGCFCKRGLVRNEYGKCVLPEQCPKEEKCGKDEVFSECGSACPPSCANKDKQTPCTLQCVKGCFCKRGLVRNENGQCVRPEECPKQEKCGKDEVYQDCGPACPLFCANKDKPTPCTLQCVSGCFCKSGYIRNDNGLCIPIEQCPKEEKCEKDEVFLDCGSACPPSCANIRNPIACTLQCVSGCFCKDGLVRSSNGKCILPQQCAQDEPLVWRDTSLSNGCPDINKCIQHCKKRGHHTGLCIGPGFHNCHCRGRN
ncbi:zonadhesin-like isoform X2 [Stegodyphus dumicola]|uniref:zonadhesin-like isoform X2 n=1 Tax=Stegodyphus dumicola TaxID=202533 RepID=UPI0015B19007|nr:zonadhesin-like isoform X2 [Stegodyphus dumicola]